MGDQGFGVVYQLEALAQQEAPIIPGQAHTVIDAVIAIPAVDAHMLEAGGGLEAAQGVVPPLVTRTGTQLHLPLHFAQVVTLVTEPVLPEPLLIEEPAQGVIRFPEVAGLDVIAIVALEVTGKGMPPVAVTRLGGHIHVQVPLLRVGVLQFQRQVDPAIPDPVLDHRLRLHQLSQLRQLEGLGLRLAIDQKYLPGGLGRLNAARPLRIVAGLDQQLPITLQGADTVYPDRDLAGKLGLDDQLVAFHDLDSAGEPVAVIQPDGIGDGGECEQQGQQQQTA